MVAKRKAQATKKAKSAPKKKKDPNAPKRPATAFIFFAKVKRPELKAESPDASFAELGKMLGAAWRELDDDDKQPFQDQYDEAKIKYTEAMEVYTAKKEAEAAAEEEEEEDEEEEEEESSDEAEASDSN